MQEISVGKILNFIYDNEKHTLRVILEITDENFKERIIRSHEFKDKIVFKGNDVMYVASDKK